LSDIEEIKAHLDIVDLIAETVNLRKSGRSYLGFCPFHANTKTPSFVVFPESQTWRCFGACAEGGDIFSFIIKREGYTFKEALQTLAERAGVKLKERTVEPQDESRHKLLELNLAAAHYFQQALAAPVGAATRHYLTARALTPETITAFQLGYAPDDWTGLQRTLLDRGYQTEELLAVGLIVTREEGRSYDRFRHRLMIPIRNTQGQVIGFGARALAADQTPKYLNTPQTALFDKSDTLYGLDLARQPIRTTGEVVIVEGYMDVIQAYQHGAKNVVAQMGTALTAAQLKRLAPLAPKIVLALDADAAGNAATVRSLSVARQLLPKKHRPTSTSRGIELEAHLVQEIYIAPLPPGKDPDDLLKEGLTVWQEVIAQAVPALDFYEALILRRTPPETPQGKSLIVQQLLPIYREIGDEIEKAARVQQLARQIGLDERLLLAELKRPLPPPEAAASEIAPFEPAPALSLHKKKVNLEEYSLSLILAHPTALAIANDLLVQQGLTGLSSADFKQGEYREIFQALQLWTVSETPQVETLRELVDELLEQRLAQLVARQRQAPPALPANINQDLAIATLRLRLENILEQSETLETIQQSEPQNARHYAAIIENHRQQRKALEQARDALTLMGKRRKETKVPN
jgi:DNA primase